MSRDQQNIVRQRQLYRWAILFILMIGVSMQTPILAQTYGAPSSRNGSIQDTAQLKARKLQLEVEKLERDNANNERNLVTVRGLVNLLYGNGSVIIGLVLGFWAIYKYMNDTKQARENGMMSGLKGLLEA